MAAAAAEARVVAATRARAEAHKQVQNFDWSSGTDWKTAANIQAQGVRCTTCAKRVLGIWLTQRSLLDRRLLSI
ncbi:unnamed protein product [Miscanthus lutarioriparius]|uniref:Uncharacterized protein n=1 Tax=Miscanthus lutarioriparius TaxID=422564 RepID=A0A811R6M5_9POAL|nr:unnamed protein product [Miscanthus lutarioriparius]